MVVDALWLIRFDVLQKCEEFVPNSDVTRRENDHVSSCFTANPTTLTRIVRP